MNIHPTAIIHPGAKVACNVTIGPYSIIGENVELGEGSEVMSHVVIDGHTRIGKNNRIFPFTTVGLPPQDLKYRGEPTASKSAMGTPFANASPSIAVPPKGMA